MRWVKEEINYLKENYPTEISLKDISEKLNKSVKAIKHKAAREGLSRPKVPHNKPKNKNYRNIIDKEYYEKHKKKIYHNKKKRLRKRKIELIKLLGGMCKNCGYNKCIWALDFHHIYSKEGLIAHIITHSSKEKALKEVKKCIILCANCHRELHYKNRYGDII